MCIRDREISYNNILDLTAAVELCEDLGETSCTIIKHNNPCLLYTSDAADERSSVDLGGRRIIKNKNIYEMISTIYVITNKKLK